MATRAFGITAAPLALALLAWLATQALAQVNPGALNPGLQQQQQLQQRQQQQLPTVQRGEPPPLIQGIEQPAAPPSRNDPDRNSRTTPTSPPGQTEQPGKSLKPWEALGNRGLSAFCDWQSCL